MGMLGKLGIGSLSAVFSAVVLRYALSQGPSPEWHKGPEWERLLTLYDRWAADGFKDCEAWLVPTDFGSTQVWSCGDLEGPPVLMLSGAGSSSLIYTTWILPRLVKRNFHVLAVDFVCDVGRSSPLNGNKANCPKSRDDLAVWVKQVLTQSNVSSPVSLVGYSYGSFISATTAVKEPELVDKLVMIAPAGVFAPVSLSFIVHALFYTHIYSGATGFGIENWMGVKPGFDYTRDIDPEFVEYLRANKKVFPHATTLVDANQFPEDELAILGSRPTLVLFGENETVFEAAVAEQAAEKVAGLQLRVYPDTGHLLIIEEPARQQAEDEIVQFLTT
mmetsp:Transcript_9613/g.27527  ORF Transcript_9613/g.27527 Transcript_9613/m.27527 type:complete len:332 (-) Transcript_9613:120-1115(-)|eukprot:CAMPEP_0117671940 /NCGR_PEP_ID=MMETSP0804-20121206/13628_1 /TAXON_ID=1074897 /ORGANISM="Tetraselmis astigmatica, Strain CCMP880" /LENGTH=331 /DNA_ID=CAMNT_0005480487 /DNA_START=74 /DNA_END=1069 /DNA_ORIENTATION=+